MSNTTSPVVDITTVPVINHTKSNSSPRVISDLQHTFRSQFNGSEPYSEVHQKNRRKMQLSQKRNSDAAIHIAQSKRLQSSNPNTTPPAEYIDILYINPVPLSMHYGCEYAFSCGLWTYVISQRINVQFVGNGSHDDSSISPRTRRRAGTYQPKPLPSNHVQFTFNSKIPNHSLKGRDTTMNERERPKSVKFSAKPTSQRAMRGISFRKSHNNLPVMHPDEVQRIRNSRNSTKRTMSLSPFASPRGNRSPRNGPHPTANEHADGEFLDSLMVPTKQQQLNDVITNLKNV